MPANTGQAAFLFGLKFIRTQFRKRFAWHDRCFLAGTCVAGAGNAAGNSQDFPWKTLLAYDIVGMPVRPISPVSPPPIIETSPGRFCPMNSL